MGVPAMSALRLRTGARAFVAVGLVWASLASTARIASAAPPNDDAHRAVELFERSATAYDAGRFADAVQLLKDAYRLRPDPVLLYNLARAYEGMGALADAVEAYTRFLTAQPTAKDRGAIEARVATLRAQLDEQARLERERDVAQRARQEQAVRLHRAEAEQAKAATPPRRPSAIPWVVAGVGGAGLATGAVFGVLSAARHSAAISDAQASIAGDQAQARTFATVANVTLVAGGVLAALGLGWGLLDLRASRASADTRGARVTWNLGPGWAGLTVRGP